jgi:hypothetical protein
MENLFPNYAYMDGILLVNSDVNQVMKRSSCPEG